MTSYTLDSIKFARAWEAQVMELTHLRNTLPMEHWEALDSHIRGIKELIILAANELDSK